MKVFSWVKKVFEKIKLERIAIVSVIVTQSLKRLIQSEFALLVLEMAPIPWVNFISKVMGYITKANEIVPVIVKQIVVTKGILDEAIIEEKLAMDILIDHLKYYNKEDLDEFLAFFSLQVMNALAGDGIIDEEEKSQIIESAYQKLFKQKQGE